MTTFSKDLKSPVLAYLHHWSPFFAPLFKSPPSGLFAHIFQKLTRTSMCLILHIPASSGQGGTTIAFGHFPFPLL